MCVCVKKLLFSFTANFLKMRKRIYIYFFYAFLNIFLYVHSLKVLIATELSLYRSFSLHPVSVHSGAGTRATVSFVSLGYFIVSPVIRFPRVRNHRGVPRYRWSRSSTERDKGVSGRAKRGEGGKVARKRNGR